MAGSAEAAVERLRALRVQARQRREQVREAVRRVRARNHEESLQAMLRVRAARRSGPAWPTTHPERQLQLFDSDEGEPPTPHPPPAIRFQPHADDDDWSNETWLH